MENDKEARKDWIAKDLMIGLMARSDFLKMIRAEFCATEELPQRISAFYKDLRQNLD